MYTCDAIVDYRLCDRMHEYPGEHGFKYARLMPRATERVYSSAQALVIPRWVTFVGTPTEGTWLNLPADLSCHSCTPLSMSLVPSLSLIHAHQDKAASNQLLPNILEWCYCYQSKNILPNIYKNRHNFTHTHKQSHAAFNKVQIKCLQ